MEIHALDLQSLAGVTEGLARRAIDRNPGVLDLTPDAWRSSERAAQLKGRLITSIASLVLTWLLVVGVLAGLMAYQKRRVAVLNEDLAAWEVPGTQVREMRQDSPREGMIGISPRYVQDSVAASPRAAPARAASATSIRSSDAPDATPDTDSSTKIIVVLGVLLLAGAAALALL